MTILYQPVLQAATKDTGQVAPGICLTLNAVIALCVIVNTFVWPAIREEFAKRMRADYWIRRARRRSLHRSH